MTGIQAIKSALRSTQNMLGMYLGDLSDADLLVRPVPGANHIAWQIGHLLNSEPYLVSAEVADARFPELPASVKGKYTKETAASDAADQFLSKAEYLELFTSVRNATVATLERLSDADLDKPAKGPLAGFAPTVGDTFLLVSNHTLMHAGQFTVIRRKLGKPVMF